MNNIEINHHEKYHHEFYGNKTYPERRVFDLTQKTDSEKLDLLLQLALRNQSGGEA